jgi:beta-1,4-mannosyltransferase
VSFDNGADGSVAEDSFFAMKAFSKGYSFDWIEGEMYEKSSFTLIDFLQQRKRWLQGLLLVVHSKIIPFKYKIFLAMGVYSWCMMPLSSSNIIFAVAFPLACPYVNLVCAFLGGISVYMCVFGVMKSFSLYRFGLLKSVIFIIGAFCTTPMNLIIGNVAVLWGVMTNKHRFYVVQKEIVKDPLSRPLITV